MKKIELGGKWGKGKYALVDDEDYEFLISCGSWYGMMNGYAAHTFKYKGVAIAQTMHRAIMNPPSDMQIDHINHDKLDNRKSNLRVCTQSENNWNMLPYKSKSGYKGVYKHHSNDNWVAQITVPKGNRIHLGSFTDIQEAAHMYNQFAEQMYGDFARLNVL